ncbi:MAG: aminopeptidase [Patescibacteria group bacterium]
MDPRDRELAGILVDYSIRLQRGERVLVEVVDSAAPLAREVIAAIYRAGGEPHFQVYSDGLTRAWLMQAEPDALARAASYQVARIKDMQAYIGIRAPLNVSELGDVPGRRMQDYQRHYVRPINDIRVPHTKWCVLRYPTPALAQLAGMSTEAFTDYYYRVCCLDYARMSAAMDRLVSVMAATDRVRIVGPGTDLSFSIKGIPIVKCAGEMNIPDGEVYTAPVRDSVNGTVTFNTPAEYEGFTYTDIRFTFRDGRIVEAAGNDPGRINEVLDTDDGARYTGEFSLGVNPFITRPMKETLFDEKIGGSFHLTPGNAYEDADNGNRSAIHWDLVAIQTPEFGGGEIYFDDVLVRKDGLFVAKGLEVLNPDRLA